MAQPQLRPIKDGWAALSGQWAVHGATQEEALQKFREAERFYQELDARAKEAEKRQPKEE
jgi:hypothetical protein